MQIERFDSGLLNSNMYVISEGNHAIVIDPSKDTKPGEGFEIDLMIVTHEHYDHISGVNVWKERYGVPLLASETCDINLRSSRKNLSRYFEEFCELQTWIELKEIPCTDTNYSCYADKTFSDKTSLKWKGHDFKLMEIPGHSPGSIGILLDDVNFFSGDSLMEGRNIELRFPGGSKKAWREIGEPRIKALHKGITVWPGHFEGFLLTHI